MSKRRPPNPISWRVEPQNLESNETAFTKPVEPPKTDKPTKIPILTARQLYMKEYQKTYYQRKKAAKQEDKK
jgi:hypothetical protein